MTTNFEAEYIDATREAELGYSTCRVCGAKAKLSEHIAVLFGGGLLYAVCIQCVSQGESVLIHRTERGISVSRKPYCGVVAATTRDLNALSRRIK
jgi:hypothetical protein